MSWKLPGRVQPEGANIKTLRLREEKAKIEAQSAETTEKLPEKAPGVETWIQASHENIPLVSMQTIFQVC